MDPRVILSSALERDEITPIEALILMQEGDGILPELLHVANELNRRLHRSHVSYVKSKSIHYTNVCRAECSFCPFWRKKGQRGAYTLSLEKILREIKSAPDATVVEIQGGLNPDLPFTYHLEMLRAIRAKFPKLHIHAFSPAEVHFLAKRGRLPVIEVLRQLQDAGLDSMPGTGAEVLNDKVRKKICPDKLRTADWVDIIKTAHRLGIPTTATLMFGHVEDEIYLCEHLEILRNIQKETGGFTEFIPMPFIPDGSPLSHRNGYHRPPRDERVQKLYAISRIFFNRAIPNIQANWIHLGLPNAVRTLGAGANDLGGLMCAEDVIHPSCVNGKRVLSTDCLRQAVRRVGCTAAERDPLYKRM
jgi:5-amino-6-(D-ribitylamino)uracil---L-tyrosine 4-hydroxyphenyl transferase